MDDMGLLGRLAADLTDAVARDLLGGVVDVVADVVEHAGEPVHVVAVERRHEGAVEQVDDLVRDPVALVLELLDLPRMGVGAAGKSLEQLDQSLRDRHGVRGGAVVELEELALLRDEAEACHGPGYLPDIHQAARFNVRLSRYRGHRWR